MYLTKLSKYKAKAESHFGFFYRFDPFEKIFLYEISLFNFILSRENLRSTENNEKKYKNSKILIDTLYSDWYYIGDSVDIMWILQGKPLTDIDL